jgi:hypothetical protein
MLLIGRLLVDTLSNQSTWACYILFRELDKFARPDSMAPAGYDGVKAMVPYSLHAPLSNRPPF